MRTFSRKNYFYFIAFMLMASEFLPLVFNNLPPIMRSHHPWTILWGISLLLFAPKILFKKTMLYVTLYGLFLLLMLNTFWSAMDEWNTRMLIMEYYNIAIGVSVITYFQYYEQYISLAKVTKWTLIFIFITAVMSIVSSSIDPMYARNIIGASSLSESERAMVMSYQKYGGGGYGTAIAFMCLIPLFIYYYKNLNLLNVKKNIIFIYILSLSFALLAMQIFSNILIAFVILLFSLVKAKNRIKTMVVVSILLFLFIQIPKNYYINGLYNVSNLFSTYNELNYKFSDMARYLETGASISDPNPQTSVAGRMSRYPMLFEAFQHSPILGCYFLSSGSMYREEGAHLHWMNKLTTTGIIGLLFFLSIPLFFIKQQIKIFNSEYKYYFLLGSYAILGYGVMKVIAGREAWYAFFIILPGLYYLPLLTKKKID